MGPGLILGMWTGFLKTIPYGDLPCCLEIQGRALVGPRQDPQLVMPDFVDSPKECLIRGLGVCGGLEKQREGTSGILCQMTKKKIKNGTKKNLVNYLGLVKVITFFFQIYKHLILFCSFFVSRENIRNISWNKKHLFCLVLQALWKQRWSSLRNLGTYIP